MEVAWEDRGKHGWEIWAGTPRERRIEWHQIAGYMREHWNNVYDACVNTEILHKSSGSPDGGMIKIVVTKESELENG
jgi:hypothetical protein